jgi:hypothetical protein
MTTQVEIARRLGLDVSTVNKILHRVPGLKWREETVKAVFDTAGELGYNYERLKFRHRRAHPRYRVNLPAEVEIEVNGSGVQDRGTATIQDLSLGGARISQLNLEGGFLPIKPFVIVLRAQVEGKKKEEFRTRLVRVVVNGKVDYCVKFDEANASVVKAVKRLLSAK